MIKKIIMVPHCDKTNTAYKEISRVHYEGKNMIFGQRRKGLKGGREQGKQQKLPDETWARGKEIKKEKEKR